MGTRKLILVLTFLILAITAFSQEAGPQFDIDDAKKLLGEKDIIIAVQQKQITMLSKELETSKSKECKTTKGE